METWICVYFPNFDSINENIYKDMMLDGWQGKQNKGKEGKEWKEQDTHKVQNLMKCNTNKQNSKWFTKSGTSYLMQYS